MIDKFRAIVINMLEQPEVEVKRYDSPDGEIYSICAKNLHFTTKFAALFTTDVNIEIGARFISLSYNQDEVEYEIGDEDDDYIGLKEELITGANRYAGEVMDRFITDMTEHLNTTCVIDGIGMKLQN